ncbi:MAG: hypothetical protein ABJZ55_23700 [Fuerstiella sp.]
MSNVTVPVIVALVVSLLTCCECVAVSDHSAHGTAVINYQSQTNLFKTGQGTVPFLVEQTPATQTNSIQTKTPPATNQPALTLLSMAPAVAQSEESQLENSTGVETSDDNLQSVNQPSITELADTLQWTILLLTAVVAAVMGIHRLTKQKQKAQSNHRMEYQGCLPVRGQFSMHLVTIIDRQFLVTTDRSGVKTVNALNDWDQFSAPVDPSLDDQFPELSMESKTHHG